MKIYKFVLFVASAIFFVIPIAHAADTNSFSITCAGYRYDTTHVLDGFDIRVTKDGKTRSFFLVDIMENLSMYGGVSIGLMTQCQGSKLPFMYYSSSRYGSLEWVGLINPETTAITKEEKIIQGDMSWGSPASISNPVKQLGNALHAGTLKSIMGGVTREPITGTADVRFLQSGIVQTMTVPLLKSLVADGLSVATTTATGYQYADTYSQQYFFDGTAVIVNEFKRLGSPGKYFCAQDNPNICSASLNKWYRYVNGTWQEISVPVFETIQYAPQAWNRLELVSKSRVGEGSNNLNDRSYYAYDSSNHVVRYVSASQWNTTVGNGKITCGDTTYALFEKQFADKNAYEANRLLAYPVRQYMLEIRRGTNIKAIPLPHDGKASWQTLGANIIGCVQNRALIESVYTTQGPNSEYKSVYRSTVVDPTDTSVQLHSSTKTFPTSGWYRVMQSPAYLWAQTAYLYKSSITGEISGEATISAITKDGKLVTIKPPFLKPISNDVYGGSMQFSLDRSGNVIVYHSSYASKYELSTTKYYRYNGSAYQEISEEDFNTSKTNVFETAPFAGTDLYLQQDGTRIALKSYYLERYLQKQAFLLHDFGSSSMSLNWYRIGPLENNGTRNIRYSVTVNGRTQVWNATVR